VGARAGASSSPTSLRPDVTVRLDAVSALRVERPNPGGLAPAAHPAFGGTVGLRGLRPACWTPSTTARKCSVSVTSVGVLGRSRASGPGSSSSRIRSSILFGWRRRESNPGPRDWRSAHRPPTKHQLSSISIPLNPPRSIQIRPLAQRRATYGQHGIALAGSAAPRYL
jgi:hypothetical protein